MHFRGTPGNFCREKDSLWFFLNDSANAPKSKVSGNNVRHGEVKHRNSKWPVCDPDVALKSRKNHVTNNQYQYVRH
jgi:hypothetical protein